MNALSHFIGHWKSKVSVTPADGNIISYETDNIFSCLSGGEFVEDRAVGPDGQSGHIGIWYKDGENYRSVYFISPGKQRIEFVYKWNEDTLEMKGEAPLPDGSTMKAVDKVIDENHYRWEIDHVSADGVSLLKMVGLQSRVTS